MDLCNTQNDQQKAPPGAAAAVYGGKQTDVQRTDRQRAYALSRILLSFCVLAGIAYLPLALRLLPVLTVRHFIFHGVFSLILVLLGVSFLFYYPYKRFGLLSSTLSVAFIYGGLVLAFWFRTENQKELVLLILGLICLVLTLWKFGFTDIPFPARLPFNVCNILVIFIIVRPLYHTGLPLFFSVMLDNYILCFGLTAALVNYLIGVFFDGAFPGGTFGMGLFYRRLTEGVLLHSIFFTYCVYALVTECIKVNAARSMTNMIWIIPWFFLFSFINQIWKTDYFFTGTHGVTPGFLKKLYFLWPWRISIKLGPRHFDVNILHSLFVIGAAALVLFGMSSALQLFQKTFPVLFYR